MTTTVLSDITQLFSVQGMVAVVTGGATGAHKRDPVVLLHIASANDLNTVSHTRVPVVQVSAS